MKAGFITLGCKVNIYESNALKEELINKGIEVKDDATPDCDIFIINTCSVTNQADAKSRKMIRKCINMNPKAIICAMGCYVQTNENAVGTLPPLGRPPGLPHPFPFKAQPAPLLGVRPCA